MFPMTPPCQSFCFNNFFFFDDSVNFLSSETKNVHMNQHPFHYLFDLLENLTNALLPNCACKETRAHSAVSRFTVLESSIAPVLIIERDGHFFNYNSYMIFFFLYFSENEKNNVLLLLCECVHRVQTDTLGASVSTKKKKKTPFYMISHSQKKKFFFLFSVCTMFSFIHPNPSLHLIIIQ